MMMMIPEPWSDHESMDDDKRAFYQYHSSLMEPWDGPASIAFTDGKQIGAVLDRNGLRPSRYYVTKDDLVVMASEAGVLDLPPQDVVQKGRLQPGRMFLVDTEQGRIIDDEEIKRTVATEQPYRRWLDQHLVQLHDLPAAPQVPASDPQSLLQRQIAFGYTFEDQRLLLAPMAASGVEAVGSMGNDTPLAALSSRPRLLYDYFKQLFAQVTNPPIDCIREELITASEVWLGAEGNLLQPQPGDCRRLELKGPILTNEEFARVRRMQLPGLKVGVLSMLFRAARGEKGLTQSMEELCQAARRLIEEEEVNILILSDRGVEREFAAIPALLAVSGLHHYLIREGLRMRVSLVLESGEPREVQHFSLLIGYGCAVINPYLAFESIEGMIHEGMVTNVDSTLACKNYVKAATKGVIKVMSKMGISAIQSYHGAQVFEAVGLHQELIDHYFTWTASRIGGVGMDVIAQEVLMRHRAAFPARQGHVHALDTGGLYQWRAEGEHHLFNPESIHRLQKAVRTGNYAVYKSYARLIDDQSTRLATLRGLLEFKPSEACADRGGRVGREHRQALQDRRDVLRLDQQGGARDAGDRDEPHRRQEQHRRGRRGSGALPAPAQRRLEEQRHQAGGLGPLRCHQPVPGQRPRAADQDGAGRQARRGRPAAWHQGVSLDRQDAAHHRRRRPDLPAAASRHLFDRGPGRADPRPEERQSRGAHQRQAGRRGRRRHHCRGRGQGACRCGADQRARRRHRRLAADLDHARRAALGAGSGRDASDPGAEQPAQPHRGGDRRAAEDRPRCGGRRVARRRGIRLCDRPAGGRGLHHDARVPPEHLPGGSGDPGSASARALHR